MSQTELARLESLETRMSVLADELAALRERASWVVPITCFAPEPFESIDEIKAVVEEIGGEYLASFYDANVSAQGDTRQEAIDNLKDLLLSRFDHLDAIASEKLGKSTQRQIAVLRRFIRRSE